MIRVFAKNRFAKTLSKPPVLEQDEVITGWVMRYDYPTVIPYIDTLSCTRPVFRGRGVTTLSAGWATDSIQGYEEIFNTNNVFTPIPDEAGILMTWKEIATNTRGLTAKNSESLAIEILEYPSAPIIRAFTLSGSNYSPSTPITTTISLPYKTTLSSFQHLYESDVILNIRDSWTNRPLFPQPLSSEWVVDGISVPSTTNTVTFLSSTAIRDCLVQFSISAQNYSGLQKYRSSPRLVSPTVDALALNISQNILSRTTNLPGGSASMNAFSTKNHTTNTYVRNPDLWCGANLWTEDLTPQFTSCAVYKTFSYESYGGVLITPRHVLYCKHAHPQAKGTWSPNLNQSCDLRFVTTDNVSVSCTQLHQASSTIYDLAVGVLDRDMAELGLHISPICTLKMTANPLVQYDIGNAKINALGTILQSASPAYSNTPIIAMSQGAGRATSAIPPTPVAKYPQYNDIMLHIATSYSTNNYYLSNFRYSVWDGDSGTPVFVIINDTVYLHGIMVTQNFGYTSLNIDNINQIIAQADANAIAMGRLAAPTGYTVTDTNPVPITQTLNTVYSL
jgi:hypothetical protein